MNDFVHLAQYLAQATEETGAPEDLPLSAPEFQLVLLPRPVKRQSGVAALAQRLRETYLEGDAANSL